MFRGDSLMLFLLLALVFLTNGEEINSDDSELHLLHVVFRHGDRSPINIYPNDPNPPSFWKQGLGELSLLGKKQHFALGKFLKERYKDFLTGNPREVQARSSGKDRCLESAESHLASLYAPSANWSWNPQLEWQPIPIQTVPLEDDGMLNPSSNCPAAEEEALRIESLPGSRSFLEQNKELFEKVSRESGAEVHKWNDLSFVFDTLNIESQYKLEVPEWAKSLWENMSYVHNMTFYLNYQTKEMQKLRAGVLLGDIADHMRLQMENATATLPRLYLYSTHDTQVAVLINALGLTFNTAPNYCATVLLELWNSSSRGWEVAVWLLDTPTPEVEPQIPIPLTLPACGVQRCPLDTFLALVQPMELRDWKQTCGLADSTSFPRPALMLISLLSVALLVVVALCAFMLCRRSGLAPPPYHSLNAS